MIKTAPALTRFKFKKGTNTSFVDTIYGIDPGKTGAIVAVELPRKLAAVHLMPETDDELAGLLDTIIANKKTSEVWIERVPKFAGKNQSGASVATLFANYRYIVGYLEGRGIVVNEVVPQVWMKPYRLLSKEWQMMSYNDRKKYLHSMAISEFFIEKKNLPRWAADAALIALHGAAAGETTA